VQVWRRKVLRDGQGTEGRATDAQALDCVIHHALILDWTGSTKADVGIKHGRIAGIGKAGNPDTMAGVTPGWWWASPPRRSPERA